MSNYRKSKIFGKKEKFNLVLLVGISLAVILIMYFSSKPAKMKDSKREFGKAELYQNDGKVQQELNINDNGVIDNAIQVKDDSKKDFDNSNRTNNSVSKKDLAKTNDVNGIVKSDENVKEVANSNVKEGEQKITNKSDEVQKNSTTNQETNKNVVKEDSEKTTQVSNPSNISFVIPVEGNVIREFTTDTVFSKTLNTWRTREGIDFKAELGAPVVAVLDGVVEKIDNDLTERGEYIVIKHDDGFKTVYTNLDEEVKVVNGQKVRKGEVIATVGNTSGNYSNEDYGSHFNFVMYLNNEEVNPSEYINFK